MTARDTLIALLASALLPALGAAHAIDAPPALLAIGRAPEAPHVDGRLDDACWAGAACAPVFVDWQSGQPVDVQSSVRTAWDEQALYVAFACTEPYLERLVANTTERDGAVWTDDCVELFLRPNGEGGYVHLMVNSAGVLRDEGREGHEWNSAALAAADVPGLEGSPEGWTAELAIPWADLGGPPAPGNTWTGNFTRARRTDGTTYSCWNWTAGPFHNTARFARLTFVEHTAAVERLDLGPRYPGVNPASFGLNAHPTVAPCSLVLDVGEGAPVLELAADDAGPHERPASYTLGYAVPGWLTVRAVSEDAELFRMSIPPGFTSPPMLAQLHGRVAELNDAAAWPEALRPAVARLAARGAEILAGLDGLLAQACAAGRTITPAEWDGATPAVLGYMDTLAGPTLWTKPPLAISTPDMMPEALDEHCVLEIVAVQGEREPAALMISNVLGHRPLALKVQFGAFTPALTPGAQGDEPPFDPHRLRLSEAVMVRSKARGIIGDAMVPLDPAGRVAVPPGETREVWVTLDSRGAQPGAYQGTVRVSALDESEGIPARDIAVRIVILPVQLPARLPIPVFAWDYNCGARNDAYLAHLSDCYTTAFQVTNLPSPGPDGHTDFSVLDSAVERLQGRGILFLEAWFMRGEGWQPRYAKWVRDLAAYMRSRGLDYGDWVLHIFDETLNDKFLGCAKGVKEADARVRIFSDSMGDPERLAEFAPVLDYWCPVHHDLHRPGFDFMRGTGLPIWTYECGSGKGVTPTKNRALVWKAWKYRLDGVSYWTYSSGMSWNDMDGIEPDWAKIYPDAYGGPIPSKRWEGWREGLEDYLLLTVLEGELSRLDTPPADVAALLNEARAEIEDCDADPGRLLALRRAIAEHILALRGEDWAADFSFIDWAVRRAGDGQGAIAFSRDGREGRAAAHLTSSTAGSWTFLTRTLDAAKGDRVRFSCWVRSNRPVKAVIADGFRWGDSPAGHHLAQQNAGGSGDWQPLVIEAEIAETPVEVAVGFDYNCAEAEAWICDPEIAVD
ncbi:MAG: DUF4091 domain-containing protein [Candidatus Hydrogenedentes bacterium]|nr:DUF4091 domain-containing protein [Candidatus Hydrogenedentota bacterium]